MAQQRRRVKEPWWKTGWRPAMAWQYLAVCLFDFIFFPIIAMLFAKYAGVPYVPWVPITLREAGLYHIAMAGIIGLSAWTRGLEKIKRTEKGVLDANFTVPVDVANKEQET